jgi:uncharacterized protein (DUF427 family)
MGMCCGLGRSLGRSDAASERAFCVATAKCSLHHFPCARLRFAKTSRDSRDGCPYVGRSETWFVATQRKFSTSMAWLCSRPGWSNATVLASGDAPSQNGVRSRMETVDVRSFAKS